MNFLPIRTRITGVESYRELMGSLKTTVLEAQSNQDCPFEKIVSAINPERRSDRNPLYNAALLFQNFPVIPFKTDGLRGSLYPVSPEDAQLDLRIEAQETIDGLALMCEYKKAMFGDATIVRFLGEIRNTLQTIVKAPDTAITAQRSTLADDGAQPQEKPKRNIVISGTFTTEPIEDALRFWMVAMKCAAEKEFAPFDQVFQQLLDPSSPFAQNKHGLNVTLLRLEDWMSQSPVAHSNSAEQTLNEFVAAARSYAGRGGAPHLNWLCPPTTGATADPQRMQQLAQMEERLCSELADTAGVYTVTTSQLHRLYPVADYYEPSSAELGKVPYTPQYYTALATMIARQFHALNRRTRKVIALDCDNTLWAGVCGEDGPKGVQINGPFKTIQDFMRAQHDAGMLLCLCSKNNDEDVWDVFHQRLEMPFRREHFCAARLNWTSKSQNLAALGQELKLGLDSFIFVDDNPGECGEVKANCPEVRVCQFASDPPALPAC